MTPRFVVLSGVVLTNEVAVFFPVAVCISHVQRMEYHSIRYQWQRQAGADTPERATHEQKYMVRDVTRILQMSGSWVDVLESMAQVLSVFQQAYEPRTDS